MHATFFECKCSSPVVYFRLLKDVSIPQRRLYSFVSLSGGYVSTGRFVSSVSCIYGIEKNDMTFENTANYEKFDKNRTSEFLRKLKEMNENE